MLKKILLITASLVTLPLSLSLAHANEYLFLGTGNVSGIYYPTGNALCRMLEKSNQSRKVTCVAESTGGSSDNLSALRQQDIDLAIVQSDVHWQAYNGKLDYSDQAPYQDLRSLFSLYPEAFTVLASSELNFTHISQLFGHSINIGPAGSGQKTTMLQLMQTLGWTNDDFSSLNKLKPDEQSRALCSNKVDAIVYVVGHPNTSIKQATTMCESRLLNLSDENLQTLLLAHDYFREVVIKADTYHNNEQDITTFGVSSTVVADKQLSEQTVYDFVSAIFENIDTLRQLHPALRQLKIEDMVHTNLSAPLHPGALRYYREQGWITPLLDEE